MSNVPLHLILGNIPTPQPGAIENWLIAFAAIVAIVNQGMGLFTKFKPQMIQLAEQFVSRSSFHKHAELNRQAHDKIEARVAALERKLEDDKDEIIKAGEDRATKIHDRINVAIVQIGELRGEVRHLSGGHGR
jgi:restriction endonuclease Mrr